MRLTSRVTVGKDRRLFHDGAYGSCTKYIADIGKSVFGVDFSSLGELVHAGPTSSTRLPFRARRWRSLARSQPCN